MKNSKKSFFLLTLLTMSIILPFFYQKYNEKSPNDSNIKLKSDDGASNYEIIQSVTYEVEVNFTLTHNSYDGDSGKNGKYWFQFSHFDDRQPNSSLTRFVPPYQESELVFNKITGIDGIPHTFQDRFNNTYDIFNNTSLASTESVTLSQKYLLKLNEISFANVNMSEIEPYDKSDEIFDLYCNHSETYYEKNDPNINATSFTIVNPEDNPITKATKICNWVSDYLTYDDTLPAQEKGALWAYDNKRGDCSEYSSLMITLLRCQGIPARKVTGYVISANPSLKPYIGQKWSYNLNDQESNSFLGHAWVEYYVPNIGWIACDPTWNSDGEYANKIDYLRINLNVGAWFSIPGGLPDESEFPNPCIVYQLLSDSNYQYAVTVIVLNTDLLPDYLLIWIIGLSSLAGIIIIITVIVALKRRKKRSEWKY
ncbi:MAG: transglutaminase-like domain-containing protein [Promethearchaeota archaeon]